MPTRRIYYPQIVLKPQHFVKYYLNHANFLIHTHVFVMNLITLDLVEHHHFC